MIGITLEARSRHSWRRSRARILFFRGKNGLNLLSRTRTDSQIAGVIIIRWMTLSPVARISAFASVSECTIMLLRHRLRNRKGSLSRWGSRGTRARLSLPWHSLIRSGLAYVFSRSHDASNEFRFNYSICLTTRRAKYKNNMYIRTRYFSYLSRNGLRGGRDCIRKFSFDWILDYWGWGRRLLVLLRCDFKWRDRPSAKGERGAGGDDNDQSHSEAGERPTHRSECWFRQIRREGRAWNTNGINLWRWSSHAGCFQFEK